MSFGSATEYDPSLPSRWFACLYVLPFRPANRAEELLTDSSAPERLATVSRSKLAGPTEVDPSAPDARPKSNEEHFEPQACEP